jgi:hypothetical protein
MLDGATARECTLTGAGAKAAAEPNRAKERTEKSFIVAMLWCIGLLVRPWGKRGGKEPLTDVEERCGSERSGYFVLIPAL